MASCKWVSIFVCRFYRALLIDKIYTQKKGCHCIKATIIWMVVVLVWRLGLGVISYYPFFYPSGVIYW